MHERPALTALLGTAASGKTTECLRRYRAAQGHALLLVPSKGDAERVKAALKPTDSSGVWTFEELIRFLANAGGDQPSEVRRSFQRFVLGDLFAEEILTEGYFGRMHGTPGFVPALSDCLRELKLSGIAPEHLESGSRLAAPYVDDPAFSRKTAEIARLYRRYELFQRQHRLCDEDDLPRYAAEQVRANADLPCAARVVLVDGFHRFSQVWRDLLAALAARDVEIVVTLPYDPTRPLLFATPARTLELLQEQFRVQTVSLDPPASERPLALRCLSERLFRETAHSAAANGKSKTANGIHPAAEQAALSTLWEKTGEPLDAAPNPPALRLFDAPNPYVEAEMVARALRRAHDDARVPWSECVLFLRSAETYRPILASVCEKFGVPLTFGQASVIADNTLIKTVLTLFDVILHDWRREDVIAFLKSSYVPANKLAVDALRRLAQRRGVREGRDNWRRLTEELTGRGDALGGLLHDMLVCDARLTERKQTCAEFREEIALAYPLFGIQAPPHSLPNALADKHALQQANQTMDDIVLSARMSERGVLSFAQFARLVTAGWRTATYCPPLDRERVAVLEPYDARQRAASFVAVMGLTERVFPRQVREDPFFRDEERAALRTFARLPLEDQQERAEEERLLFYLAVTAPAGSEARLVLTYPRTTEESDALPSFYVDEVRACFAGEDAALLTTETCTLSDVAPHPEACVTERDRLLALCERFVTDPADQEAAASDPAVRAVLATRHLPLLPRLTAEVALREHTRRRRYGITELEAYLRCPFQHLMRHGLMLRPEPDGGGAADRGTLFHTVLRRTFRRRAAEDRARNTPEPAALRETLHAELETCLSSHRVDASPVRRAMMERALRDALSGFAEREACYHEVFGMTPSHFELAFGTEEESTRLDDEENTAEPESPREYDSASTPRPLVIASQDGTGDIHLCGAIDRIDLSPDGSTALVMDYKLGSTVEFSVIKEGRSLQMPLYLLAVEQLWGKTGAVACYDSPRDNGRNRFYRVEHVGTQRFRPLPNGENGKLVKPVKSDEYTETLSNAIQSVRQAVQGIAAAEITPLPGKHCNHCDFVDVCRFHQDNVHDGEPFQSSSVSSRT